MSVVREEGLSVNHQGSTSSLPEIASLERSFILMQTNMRSIIESVQKINKGSIDNRWRMFLSRSRYENKYYCTKKRA